MQRPTDPLELLAWINAKRRELDRIEQTALFDARIEGRFDEAVQISGLSVTKAMALTRHENEARGRMMRWGSRP